MIQRRPSRMPGMIPRSSIAYTARRPMPNRWAISGTVTRADLASSCCLQTESLGRLDMVEARVRQDLFRSSDHVPAERVLRMDAAAFAGPPVLGTRSMSDGREAVLTYRGDLGLAGF